MTEHEIDGDGEIRPAPDGRGRAELGQAAARRRAPLRAAAFESTGANTLPHSNGSRDPRDDDHRGAPAADEAPARIALGHVNPATGGLFAPGEAEAAIDDEDLDWKARARRTTKDAFDFRAVRRSPYGLLPALVLGMITFFQALDSVAFSFASPEIARDLNIDVGDIISILILLETVGIFTSIAVGYLADRTRRTPYIGIGTMLTGVSTFFTAGGRSFAGLATPRVANAVTDIGAGIPRYSLLADYYPYDVRGKVFAFLGLLRNMAAVGAPLFIGYMLSELGWRTTFKVLSVPLVLAGVLALLVLREPIRGYFERRAMGMSEDDAVVPEPPLSFAEGFRTTFAVRTVRRTFLADVFGFAAAEISGLYFLFFQIEKYRLGPLERGFFAIPSAAAALLGGLIGGTLVDRFTRRNPSRILLVFGIFQLVLAPITLLYIPVPPLALLVVVFSVVGFFGSLGGPALGVIYSQVIPANIRTQGLQLTDLAKLGSTIILFPIARQLGTDGNYTAVWIFCVPLALLSAILFLSSINFFELDMRAAFARAAAEFEYKRARAAGQTKLLVARNLDVYYDNVQVLFDVDFDVEEGEILALLGTNGAGKSTVLRAICGSQPARSGGVIFDGRDITRMPPNEIAAKGVIQMPGGRGIFPTMTVRENLVLGGWLSDDPVESRARLAEVYEIFPRLAERLDVPAGTLSGGEQQQLSLAQAFLANPRLLLIDELSLGLSPVVVGQLVEIVKEINRRGVTVIVVEQSVNVALTIATKAIFMEKGEVRFYGETADLLRRPDILRAVYVKGTGALTTAPPSAASAGTTVPLADRPYALEVDGLVKRFGGVTAVNDVSFGLREGEVLGLIGPNGAGKTTIFDLISGHQRLDGGIVRYEGVDISGLPPEERAQRRLIRRFQDARLFPSLTVEETLLIALEQKLEVKNALLNALRAPQARKSERRARVQVDRLVELLEIGAFRDKFVRELSTGLRRIVDLACVLAAEPKVLLLDEPSSGIAQAEAEGLAPLLRRVRYETGCSILIIEHDMPLISSVSDELLALDQGEFVTRGTPDEVLNDERVIESYLGTSEAAINRSGSIA